jgi:hypothetical protein
MIEKSTSIGRWKMMVGKVNLQQHFCQQWRASTLRKCLMMFYVTDNMMAAHSNIENDEYRVQQKAKQQYFNGHLEDVNYFAFLMLYSIN